LARCRARCHRRPPPATPAGSTPRSVPFSGRNRDFTEFDGEVAVLTNSHRHTELPVATGKNKLVIIGVHYADGQRYEIVVDCLRHERAKQGCCLAARPSAQGNGCGSAETRSETGAGKAKSNTRRGYVWIPPGKFRMGCSSGDSECYYGEQPSREVTVSVGFWLAQTTVTERAWQKYRLATGASSSPAMDDPTGLPDAGA